MRTTVATFALGLVLFACTNKQESAARTTEAGRAFAALVDRYSAAGDAEREAILVKLSDLPCDPVSLCAAKVQCQNSMLAYRSASLSKKAAADMLAAGGAEDMKSIIALKLNDAEGQFDEARRAFPSCVSAAAPFRGK